MGAMHHRARTENFWGLNLEGLVISAPPGGREVKFLRTYLAGHRVGGCK